MNASTKTRTELRRLRELRGIAASELARQVGISRQTIYAIEDGSYVPNTAVALRLSRALQASVEELFHLDEETPPVASQTVRATLLTDWNAVNGRLVQLAQVGEETVAVPVAPHSAYLPLADGLIAIDRTKRSAGRKIRVEADVSPKAPWRRRVLLAGCDPALATLADSVRTASLDVLLVHASSLQAMRWLANGLVHIAGSHLHDGPSGEYNLPQLRRLFPEQAMRAVTFACWQQGLAVRAGNPKGLKTIGDLASARVSIVNREKGSGSRDLLDAGLHQAGIDAADVAGYKRLAASHLAATESVAQNGADGCIAAQAAASAFGLDFNPLEDAQFDLCLSEQTSQLKSMEALFDVLDSAALRSRLQNSIGYDCSRTGTVRTT